jgi:hypothetical protein
LTLNWGSSIDDTGVAGDKIYRDGVIVATFDADIPTTYKAVCSFH